MCDYDESSQLQSWLYTPQLLEQCRARANREARIALAEASTAAAAAAATVTTDDATAASRTFLVHSFACGYGHNTKKLDEDVHKDSSPWTSPDEGHSYLTPAEEGLLVDFYASKLPNLIGPLAQVPRLRRDIKVSATAALLFRRFYLSNSVMIHDPKAVMVAAAFLGAKVEDATTDVRYLEEGTKLMNAPVTVAEILPAELALLSGIHFDLLCFHPYKAVLALTEDLRTYLKSEKGRRLATFRDHQQDRPVVGQDLKPMHDAARQLVDDAIVSDIPLLYSPGQIGLAALMVANEELQNETNVPTIDWLGYVQHRFDDNGQGIDRFSFMRETTMTLCDMLKGLREGKHGCGNYHVNLNTLKGVHKKLKKIRAWGQSASGKKKKRKVESDDGPDAKRVNTAS